MSLKRLIANNESTIGSWITIGHPAVAELMARCGFDWLTIDLEHSPMDFQQAENLVRTLSLCGVSPLVRVGKNDANLIKRAMDTGCHGVIVPMVNSAEEAEYAVSAVKYPPQGTRGVGLARAQGYGFSFDNYLNWLRNESVVIVQIEHFKAIDNLEAILNVPGVDGTIIGPYDLSGSLGKPGDLTAPEVRDALNRYEETCKHMGKPLGAHVVQLEENTIRDKISTGYRFLAIGLDTLFLGNKASEMLLIARKSGGQS